MIEEALRRRHISPWGLGLVVAGLIVVGCVLTQNEMLPHLCCGGVLMSAIGVALMLQFRRDHLDREAEARDRIVRGDRIFHALIQVPQQVGSEDKLRSALDLPASEVHRGIAPLLEACGRANAVRIEVRELADIDQDLEVYASDVMRKALHPLGEEKPTYRETSEATGNLTLVTWLLLVQRADVPAPLPIQHGTIQHHVLSAWFDALIPPHPEDTRLSQVACSIALHDLEVAEVATIFLRR